MAQRVADTFFRVYPRLGVQQHALLRRAVLELLAEAGISAREPTIMDAITAIISGPGTKARGIR